VGGTPESFDFEATVTAGTAIAAGDVLAINGNVLERATASSTIHTILAVASETISTSATKIKVTLIRPGQIWEAATKNNTDATELYESMILNDEASVDNTDSDVTGPTGIFTCLALVGATGDKKCLGEFTRLQSTST
jgi:hypothetical protein